MRNPLHFSGFLIANIALCLYIGYKIDTWLGTNPIFLLLLLGYSVVGSFYLLIKKANKDE